ncbi:hypothetical protein HDE_13987 [Halotydeus destructor]|nr:hypothetical protein HDE_13987 [Halotydeus destructor]
MFFILFAISDVVRQELSPFPVAEAGLVRRMFSRGIKLPLIVGLTAPHPVSSHKYERIVEHPRNHPLVNGGLHGAYGTHPGYGVGYQWFPASDMRPFRFPIHTPFKGPSFTLFSKN